MKTFAASTDELVATIRDVLAERPEAVAAFLFGSAAKKRMTDESDIDVAVYFRANPDAAGRTPLEVEAEDARYPSENEIWGDLERRLKREVDLVVLNRAPATLAAAVVLEGRPCVMRDSAIMGRFSAAVTTIAEDFRTFIDEFVQIRDRSRSLSEIDRARLLRILDFLAGELSERSKFTALSSNSYLKDGSLRRDVERWVENLVNASVDIAKIVLASSGLPMPQTYRETLVSLAAVSQFESVAAALAQFTRLRNLLAHEYLDLRYPEIRKVVDESERVYGGLVGAARKWLAAS